MGVQYVWGVVLLLVLASNVICTSIVIGYWINALLGGGHMSECLWMSILV